MRPVVAVIQARMGSTRLPGKVLLQVSGDTVLGHVIRRLKAVNGVDRVVVATTTLPEDDVLVLVAEAHGAAVTRGPSEDVLSRYVLAFDRHGGETGIRVTSDCPALDPELVRSGLAIFAAERPDYLSNVVVRTYPRGYDFEIFSVAALRTAARESRDPYSREHVTPFLYQNPERFVVRSLARDDPRGSANWRITVDTSEDWQLVRGLFEALAPADPLFGLADVERYLLQHAELLELNRRIAQKP